MNSKAVTRLAASQPLFPVVILPMKNEFLYRRRITRGFDSPHPLFYL